MPFHRLVPSRGLGHVAPASTAVYLTVTPRLLTEANRRFEAFAQPAWSEGKP